MDEHRRRFHAFLATHAHHATPTATPCVHAQFARDAARHDCPLVRMTEDDLREELNDDAELVRWLLNQLRTYDCERQRIVALVFDRDTVLSEVLMTPEDRVAFTAS